MAILRSYSATFEQTGLISAAVTRYRFNEDVGSSDALDSISGLDGSYETGAAPGTAGSIGDGAASFDGAGGFVLVETLSGTLRVATLGDSLAEGTGEFQPVGETFADDLPAALEARGLTVEYFDHAISSDTTGEGLARVNDVIADTPDVVILELGTNDAGGGVALGTVEDNLNAIIDALQAAGIEHILLTSTFGAFPGRGTGYDDPEDRADFEALFPAIAQAQDIELLDADDSDKFLGGERVSGPGPISQDTIVGGVLDPANDPALDTGDGLHPNAAGIDAIVQRVVPQTIALAAAAGAVNEPLLLANGTLEVWFTADVVTGDHNLFGKNSEGPGTGGQVSLVVSDGEVGAAIGSASTNFGVNGGTVTAGALTQAVLTFGAAGMVLYVNGELVDADPHTGGLDTGLGNFEPLVIGAESGFSTPGTVDDLQRFFQGTIDEFAVYDRALTANEVQELFDAGEQGGTLVGTAAADSLIGGSDAEELRGAGGDDIIDGFAGADTLRGGAGDDLIRGGQGDDDLLGGKGADELRGGAGNDTLDGKGAGDVLAGGGGDDLLQGSAGADALSGAGGADELFGNQGTDQLSGGGGDDLLNGGNGRDNLTGGVGSDTFQIDQLSHGVDEIFDFEDGAGGDVLDLSAVLAFDEGDDVVADFVRLDEVGKNTSVEVHANGGGDDFTAVFNLIGVNGLDIGNLVSDGNLQLTSTPS